MKTGSRFNSLIYTGEKVNIDRRWLGIFICDCGDKVNYRLDVVKNGQKKACTNCCRNNGSIKYKNTELYPFYMVWNISQRRAKHYNKPFNITPQDIKDLYIKQNGRCVYTNTELTIADNFNDHERCNLSIDRIDSNLGYEISNIQLVTKQVNMSKHTISHDRFIELCKLVGNNHV